MLAPHRNDNGGEAGLYRHVPAQIAMAVLAYLVRHEPAGATLESSALPNRARGSRLGIRRNESGFVAVTTAIVLPVLIGVVGLAIDIGSWYFTQRALQNGADAAAIAAALNNSSTYQAEAQANAAQYGFVDGTNGINVTALNNQTCPNGQTTCYRVTISKSNPPQFFSEVLGNYLPTLTGTALATAETGGDCVLALNPTASGAVGLSGNASADLHCGLGIDSSSSSALQLTGNSSLTAASAQIVGNITQGGNSTVSISYEQVDASLTANPYANVQIPSFSGCNYPGATITGSATLNPGVYCGNISISGSGNVTLNPGTYIVDQGSVTISGSPTVTGNGVAIVLTSSTGSNIGSFNVSGSPVLTLAAESAGYTGTDALPGFIVFQDPRASSSDSDNFTGAAGSQWSGALYFPSQSVNYSGGATSGPGCTQIVASTVTFTGTPTLYDSTCPSTYGLASVGNFPELVQ